MYQAATLRSLPARLGKGLSAALVATALAACSPAPEQRLLEDTAKASLMPAYRDFADTATQLAAATQRFCAAPSQQALDASRELWRNSAVAWSGLQVKHFGPVTVDNVSWKVQFWPDRKNLVARKMEAFLQSGTSIDAQSIADASVVIQGLNALEYLLFDAKAGQLSRYQGDDTRRCAALQAVASHQQQVSRELYQSWLPEHGDYLGTFTQPGEGNLSFPDSQLAVATLIESLVEGAELVSRDRLSRPMGSDRKPAIAQPYMLEWWRSGFSAESILGSLNAMQRLYLADKLYGLDDYLRDRGQRALADNISAAFEKCITAAQDLDGSLFEQLSSGADTGKAQALLAEVQALLVMLKDELPAALDITLSFNGSDGD